jgi:hypothetical protein
MRIAYHFVFGKLNFFVSIKGELQQIQTYIHVGLLALSSDCILIGYVKIDY